MKSIQSLLENLKIVCPKNPRIRTTSTMISCAASIPNANSANGSNLLDKCAVSWMKKDEKPKP